MERNDLEKISAIETVLLEERSIDECAVRICKTNGGLRQTVAFIVPNGPFSPVRLHTQLQARLAEELLPSAYAPLFRLPLTTTGELDEAALARIPVIDAALIERLEQDIQLLPQIDRVAVVAEEKSNTSLSLSLSNLLPGWESIPDGNLLDRARNNRPKGPVPVSAPEKPAISHGGSLGREIPARLSDILEAAASKTGKGLVYIDLEGNEQFQCYADLLEDARRILAGMKGLDLKPGDKVIFQIEPGRDFIPAFWGCVLGGFVPVPISIAPTYRQVNSAVNKLHNAWQMLGSPPILTDSGLVGEVRSLAGLLNEKDFRVETVDDLRNHVPDHHIHDSQPDDLTLLLLTSGSTGMPKAVMLTHRNLLNMTAGTVQMNSFSGDDVTLNWMPLDHVGAIVFLGVMATDLGCRQIHVPTNLILKNPLKWLELIERQKASISWAPNFAFSLLNERAAEVNQRRWDLSSMGFLVNAGEQIVARTARNFLRLLGDHGLPDHALRPAFGMSETCSGITWSEGFSLSNSSDDMPFVDLGGPIPNASLRIVDDDNLVATEGAAGRLQVKGPSVTGGYYQNPERNREAFSDDGWFNTGDIGYLQNGRLVLTGRDKDDIIINGVNFHSHEIEAVAEEIEHVEISYTAACAVTIPGNNSDKLAIFFVGRIDNHHFLNALIKKIRGRVIQKIGVSPDYVIPVRKEAIPKTAIGKIQRSQLRQRFQASEFDFVLQQFGIPVPGSLPNWFYRGVWRQKVLPVTSTDLPAHGGFLIFLDDAGLGEAIGRELIQANQSVMFAEPGAGFEEIDGSHYRIVPDNADHYRRLLAVFAADGSESKHILHLWTYAGTPREYFGADELEGALARGVYSLLSLAQAIGEMDSGRPHRLLVVSSHSQNLSPEDKTACENPPVPVLVKTISQEMPELDCHHIDLEAEDETRERTDHILKEIRTPSREAEVAYRNGQRWVSRLERVSFPEIAPQPLPFKEGGMYLISGGLGGLGLEIAKYLSGNYNARLLLIGRTDLTEEDVPHGNKPGKASEHFDSYRRLAQSGNEIVYRAVDVCDLARLREIVAQAKSQWHCELDGIIHLAGTYHERTLMEESPESFSSILRPKVLGTWTLHQLVKDRPDTLFINFSSTSGFFGGAGAGAFAAASRFLESFSYYQRYQYHLKSYCFSWSLWDEVGMNRHSPIKKSLRAHGYHPVTTQQGLCSFLIGLRYNQARLLIGLDDANPRIRRYLETDRIESQQLTVYFTTTAADFPKTELPAVVPDRFQTTVDCNLVQLPEMPLTETGAIDKSRLSSGDVLGKATKPIAPGTGVEQQIARIWQDVLGLSDVGVHDNFFELGGHSLLLAQVQSQMQEQFGEQLSIVDMFTYPTIEALANYLAQSQSNEKNTAAQQGHERARLRAHQIVADDSDIAVIGLSCRFPGADNIEEFWRNLANGVESVDFFTTEEVIASGIAPELARDPNYVKANPILTDIESFDAGFFGYSAREVAWMDPQQRLFLECSWEAMEDAGYNPLTYEGSVGVYAGAAMNTYLLNNLYSNRHLLDSSDDLAVATLDSMGGFQMMVANDKDYLTTRVSYKLNLRGPSVNMQTACSTSLLTIHAAAQSIKGGECDMALAGGVSVQAPQKIGHLFQEGMIVSSDGHCRAFDARADGTIFGSGAGVVVLKRLKAAIADGDRVYAVIKGSAANNDGGMKVGYMAPSGDGQAGVAAEAMAIAGITADTVTYVEAHGTGTVIGDPIEVAGLAQAFRVTTDKKGFCAMGSVKTNVGHLQIASGIVGFIKTVLALHHRQIPPSLHFENPNPDINFENSPFYVNARLADWETRGTPRRAGVNSLGIGGTNVHVILQEAPEITPDGNGPECPQHLLTLSARSEAALQEAVQRYRQFFSDNPKTSLADVCSTANTGRVHFNHRLALVAGSPADAGERLRAGNYTAGQIGGERPKSVFLFTGQGSEYSGMGRQLFDTEPLFQETIDQCDAILREYDVPLLELLYPETPDLAPDISTDMTWLQPVLFSLEYALARLWQSWGVAPDVVMGHSIGEYVAACVAGVFSLEDALKLVANRGRLMQSCPEGRMLAISVSEDKALGIIAPLGDNVSLATINAPESVVVSGKPGAIEAILADLADKDGIETKLLPIPRASHSPLMEPVLAEFGKVTESVTFSRPEIPLCSNITGTLVTDEVTDPAYWVRHLREPVRFAASVRTLHDQGFDTFLEVGPKPALLGMAGQCLPDDTETLWLPSLREGSEDLQQVLQSLGQWYTRGGAVDWKSFDRGGSRRKVQLPTYPFQRQRHWIEPARPARRAGHDSASHPLLGRKLQLSRTEDIYFESEVDIPSLPWLTDHRVFDVALLPATGYLEMALAADAGVGATDRSPLRDLPPLRITNITFEQPLILPEEEAKTVQLVLSPHDGGYRFEIFSQAPGSGWMSHVAGELAAGEHDGDGAEAVDLDMLRAQCPIELPIADHYRNCRERGLDYGPSFQGIKQLFRGDGIALGEIALPGPLNGEGHEYRLHPALFDAALQVLITLSEGSGETWLPVAAEEMRSYRPAGNRLWSLVRMTGSDEKTLSADISLFDGSGAPIAEIKGFTAGRVAPETIRRHFKKQPDDLYEVTWRALPSDVAESPAKEKSESWLIFADGGGVGEELAGRLETVGDTCILVRAGTPSLSRRGMPESGVRDGNTHTLDPTDPAAFQRLLAEPFPPEAPPLAGILYLWALDAPEPPELTPETLVAAQNLVCGGALHLVQAAIENQTAAKLWLVTRNAVATGDESEPVAVAQSPLWGMGRSIAREHPELWGGLIDNPSVDELLVELIAAGRSEKKPESRQEDQIAYRGGERYVARLVRSGRPSENSLSLQANASYLITGGLGGLGLAVARWMVSEGARNLVLAGRSAPSKEAREILRELEEKDAKILVESTDISHPSQVAALFERLDGETAPLKGIIHAAGVLDDGVLREQNLARFDRLLAPKVTGGWLLHTLTQNRPLDFFVCFSSVASLIGPPGQSNHASANAFLDALAYYRHGLGLPALSINWGAWAGIGEVARLDTHLQEHLTAMGIGAIEPEWGVSVLGALMGKPENIQVAVAPTDWVRFLQQFPEVPGLFSELDSAFPKVRPARSFLEEINALPAEERQEYLFAHVRSEFNRMLGFDPSAQPDVQKNFSELGMDSLMMVEFRNRLQTSLGHALPSTLLFKHPTLEALIHYIAGEVLSSGSSQANRDGVQLPDLVPVSRQDNISLSFAQHRFWLYQTSNPDGCFFNLPYCLQITGKLDVAALKQSFDEIIGRHEILRTVFPVVDGSPIQLISPASRIDLTVKDLQGLPEETQSSEVKRLADEESYHRPFNLASGPLLRVTLMRLEEESHILLLCAHHIILDAWSLEILLKELTSFYTTILSGNPSPLSPLPIQYADYAVWQHRIFTPELKETKLDYWRQWLAKGAPPPLELSTDRQRLTATGPAGTVYYQLPSELVEKLKVLSQRTGSTLFTTMVTALIVVLYHYSGCRDIVIGSPFTNRDRQELKQLLGLTGGMLLLRLDISGNPRFSDLLHQARQTVQDAMANQYLPFDEITKILQPEQQYSSPLFRVLISFLPMALTEELVLPGVTMRSIPLDLDGAETRLDLSLTMWEKKTPSESFLQGWWRYRKDLFDEETAVRITENFQAVLEAAAARLEIPVDELPVDIPNRLG